jgi:Zn2+/Cd2+-exporting ATPase
MPANTNPAWVQRLGEFLLKESAVEAVVLKPGSHKIAVALGSSVDEEILKDKLRALMEWIEETHVPASLELETEQLLIRGDHGGTMVERKHPDQPAKKWQWREFEWPDSEEIEEESREEWQALSWQAGICGTALLAAWFIQGRDGPAWLWMTLYAVSLASGGWDASKDVAKNLVKGKLDIHFLMIAVAAGAVSIGAWAEGALLLFLFSASGAMEHYALHRTHREINALSRAAPKTALVRNPDGTEELKPVSLVQPGDFVIVKPGQIFPCDGEVTEGSTAADESTLTGEAQPVPKEPGDPTFSGTINLWGMAIVKVTRQAADSALQRIIHLIQEARHRRAPSQRFTDRFGTTYTWLVLILTAVMFFVWWLGFGLPAFQSSATTNSAFYRAMTLLVVASPCALVLSIPSAILSGIAWAARKGILFRGGAALEKLAEIKVIALDKTGTLTTGEMTVTSVESFPPGREDDVTKLAYALEAKSNHPIARAIVNHGKKQGLDLIPVDDFSSLTGKGLRGTIDQQVCFLGRRELIAGGELGKFLTDVPEPPIGSTEVWVVQQQLMGRLLLRDEIRHQSKAVLAAFTKKGLETVMLTGDRRAAAEAVAKEIGINRVLYGLHPEDKVNEIRQYMDQKRYVAMVGDGVNDAPCLAAAHVSVAMGGRGSDAAIEQSEVVLMNDRIEKLYSALVLSLKARTIIRQNLSISIGTVLVMVSCALLGVVPLTIGVLAHEGSTVVVCLNSLRLLFLKEPNILPTTPSQS